MLATWLAVPNKSKRVKEQKQHKEAIHPRKIEETKIGFFNPTHYLEQELLFEKAEENQILEAALDPLEWRNEVEIVY